MTAPSPAEDEWEHVHAPVVFPLPTRGGVSNILVELLPVVAAAQPPLRACIQSVENVGRLAAEAGGIDGRRGECLLEAFLLDARSHEGAKRTVRGRSAATGLALASLQEHYGLELRAPLVVTGVLTHDHPGLVMEVNDLHAKLERACEALEALAVDRGDCAPRVLFPACQLPGGESRKRLEAGWLDRLQGRHPHVHLTGVAKLTEAANLAFVLPAEGSFSGLLPELTARRVRIEELRYVHASVEELFVECRLAFATADALRDDSAARLNAVFHSLCAASFALGKLKGETAYEWPGIGTLPRVALKASLDQLTESMERHERIAPEWKAERRNYLATDGFTTYDYFTAMRTINDALQLPGLLPGHHGEVRKLKGTSGQFLYRYGLRRRAEGAGGEARRIVQDAREKLDEALALASVDGVDYENDRARVMVYVGAAATAHEAVSPPVDPAEAVALDRRHWEDLLGRFYDPRLADKDPRQDVRWALQFLYAGWAHRGWYEHLANHWRAVRHFENRFSRAQALPLARCLGVSPVPCNLPIVAFLVEAALHLEDTELLAESLAMASFDSSSLFDALPFFWRAAVRLRGESAGITGRLRRWALDEVALPLPSGAVEEEFVREWIGELAATIRDGRAREGEPARRKLLLWMGHVPIAPAQSAVEGPLA